MVEVCLILTPLLLITFLLLNLSMAIFLRSTFQQAVREGAALRDHRADDLVRSLPRYIDQDNRGSECPRVPERRAAWSRGDARQIQKSHNRRHGLQRRR